MCVDYWTIVLGSPRVYGTHGLVFVVVIVRTRISASYASSIAIFVYLRSQVRQFVSLTRFASYKD